MNGPSTMEKFDGKTVIITGASSGIGLASAIAFSKVGAKVTMIARNRTDLAEAAKKCTEAGAETLELAGDVSDMEFLTTIVERTIEKFGRIDIILNNAAAGSIAPLEMLTLEVYNTMFDINVRAPLFLTLKALPYLKTSKGCVINVSSATGQTAAWGAGVYGMSKAALDHFARCLATEMSEFGIRVNNVSPAGVITRFLDRVRITEEMKNVVKNDMKAKQKLGFIQPEEVAEAILFLASADKITGTILPVNGGWQWM